jgi:hypothetical protein
MRVAHVAVAALGLKSFKAFHAGGYAPGYLLAPRCGWMAVVTLLRATAGVLLMAIVPLFAGRNCLAIASFSSGTQTGTIQNTSVTEASGIAASRKNANVLWTHNDSGNPAQLFAMTPAGTNLAAYTITGASNVDWEDIAVGPGPTLGTQYVYVADIGDNSALRSSISVYRVPEPVVSDVQSPVTTSLSGMVKLTFAYPDGPRDAESMFVDPQTKDIYIISKRENPHRVYRAAYPQATSGTTTLQYMTQFNDADWLTGGDISVSGNEIIMRGDGSGAVDNTGRMFIRPAGGSITDTFNSTPITIPLLSDGQGEAIGFDPKGWGYYTTSEGTSRPIHYFDRLPHGDFNHSGTVEAADYSAWRKALGTIYQAGDYTTWRANYGASGPGAGAESLLLVVPEPVAGTLIVTGIATIFLRLPRAYRDAIVSVSLSPR